MSDDYIIPTTYVQWRQCIEVRCNIPLTPDYISGRLTELQDGKHPKTKQFRKLYGAEHLEHIIGWFQRAAEEVAVQG